MPDDDRPADDAGADAAGLEQLLEFIRDARGFDFTGYKRASLARRIRKRMEEVDIKQWSDYRDRLETDADEFRFLFNTILINVTGFFRDQDAWTYLQQEVVPDIVDRAGAGEEIRVWSAGCSSGEEAYSLAIAFAEVLGLEECVDRVKIYGTDVDEEALQEARTGTYPAKSLQRLDRALRDRYFDAVNTSYVFHPDLRRRVIFGRHDVTRDAPISRLDLIVCRNTLMYFNLETQRQVIERLHFALKPQGHLFLGKAEMLLTESERFEIENMRHRLFRRRPGKGRPPHQQAATDRTTRRAAKEARHSTRKRELRDQLLDASHHAVVGLDAQGTITVANAEAREQFGIGVHDIGRPFRDHEVSYRPVELRSVIERAHQERRTIRLPAVERRSPLTPDTQYLDVIVEPLTGSDGLVLGTAIAFPDVTGQVRLQQEVKRVREDLETAYEELQSTNEELETTNEELQSSIEELETTNEELQSTNEELETTNEELQSGNEELETMGEEMRIRISELDASRTFLDAVLSSLDAGVVVLDPDLRVQGWNRGAEELWGLRLDEVRDEAFLSLDFGLRVSELRGMIDECLADGRRTGPRSFRAVNRKGRQMTCAVSGSPLDGASSGGVVLLMEEATGASASPGVQ